MRPVRLRSARVISPLRRVIASSSSVPKLAPLPLYREAGGIADLDPDAARTGSIGAVDLLRHDAFGAKPAGVCEDDRYRDHRQANFDQDFRVKASTARMKGCWRRRRASSPRAIARPFGLGGLTPASASNQGSPCDRRHDVAQQPIAITGSNGLPVFRTPKHSTNSLRIAATTICLGLRRPWAFNRVTSATIAGLYRMADMAGM